MRIDYLNQNLKNKEKFRKPVTNIQTRITYQKIPCLYTQVYQIIKNWGPGPYYSLRHADRKYFSGLSLKRKGSAHVLLGEGSGKNLAMFLLKKGNFIMINEFKYGQT